MSDTTETGKADSTKASNSGNSDNPQILSLEWFISQIWGDPKDAYRKLKYSWTYPANATELALSFIYFVISMPLLIAVSRFIGWAAKIVFLLLPYYPVKNSQKLRTSSIPTKKLFILFFGACLVGYIISFVAFTFVTQAEGRFQAVAAYDTDIGYNIFNFEDDWANRLLYMIVVPFYVGIGTVIAYLCWAFQRQKTERAVHAAADDQTVLAGTRPEFSGTMRQNVFWCVVTLIFCLHFTTEYQRDVWNSLLVDYERHFQQELAPASESQMRALPLYEETFGSIPQRTKEFENAPILYWFLETKNAERCWIPPIMHLSSIDPDGTCYNASGYYYLVLNFVLLVFTVVTVLFFLSAALSVVGIRRKIIDGEYPSFSVLYNDMRLYVLSFILAKWLFLAYIVNTYVWRGSFLGETDVLDVTIVAYTIIGSIILTIPSRVVETTWFAIQREKYEGDKFQYDRPTFESLVPTGWPMVLKNSANLVIGIIFVDTVFDVQAVLSEFVRFVVN